jgi:putative polyketide hydroxylase
VLPDGSATPQVDDPYADYVPTARPGHLAPHVWLQRAGAPVYTIDLFGDGYVLLAGPAARRGQALPNARTSQGGRR